MSQGERFIVLTMMSSAASPPSTMPSTPLVQPGINKPIAETDPHFLVITYTPSQSGAAGFRPGRGNVRGRPRLDRRSSRRRASAKWGSASRYSRFW